MVTEMYFLEDKKKNGTTLSVAETATANVTWFSFSL